MKRPAVFFDRDNTLIACDGYLGDPAKVVLIEGASEAIVRVRALGCAAVVFSNQSGVARGMFGEDAVHAINHRLDEMLVEDDPQAIIDRHDFCPFHPTAKVERYRIDSDLRKPRPGMIYQAAKALDLDLTRSWVVGDAPRDIAAGHAAGLKTVLLKIASLPPSPATSEGSGVEPDFVATSLEEAIDFIERHMKPQAAAEERGAAVSGDEGTIAGQKPGATGGREKSVSDEEDIGQKPDADEDIDTAAEIAAEVEEREAAAAESDAAVETHEPPLSLAAAITEEQAVAEGTGQDVSSAVAVATEVAHPSEAAGDVVNGTPLPEPAQFPAEDAAAPVGAAAKSAGLEQGAVTSQSSVHTDQPRLSLADRSEDPVKLTPRPSYKPEPSKKPEEPKPAAASGKPAEARPNGAKPVQGGFVVKPNQAPTKMTWGERMRYVKTGVVPEPSPAAPVADAPPDMPAAEPTTQASPAAEAAPHEAAASNEEAEVARAMSREAINETALAVTTGGAPEQAWDAAATPTEPKRGVRREDADSDGSVTSDSDNSPAEASSDTDHAARRRPLAAGERGRTEDLLEQILLELRRREEHGSLDFSVSKLLAGITQVLALAAMFFAYLNKNNGTDLQATLLLAVTLQTLTISLLIMGKQR